MAISDFLAGIFRPRKPNRKEMAEEISGPTTTGVRQVISGHPAYNITPMRLARMLLAAEQGDEIPYLELAEEMEEKDCHYRAVLATRKMQVSGLPITVEAYSDNDEDTEAADLCRDILPVIRPALFDIMDAVGKGFSVSEIIWDTTGRHWIPDRIAWRDPRWFGFDPTTGRGPLLRSAEGMLTELPQDKFVVHHVKSKSGLPIRAGLARAAAWAWLFKNFDLKSWNIFCEVYGHPLRLGKYDQSATDKQKAILLRAVRDLGADHAAIIPLSMQVEFVDAKAQGNAQVFREFAEYLDMQVSKLVLGQTGTTDTGSRVGTADAHERVRSDIEQADAEALAATITRDVFGPLIRLNYGPHRHIPQLRLSREEPEDLSALAENLSKLAAIAPNLVEVSVIRDKFGFPEPAANAVCIGHNADEVQVMEEVKNENLNPKNGISFLNKAKAESDAGLLAEHGGRDWIDDLVDDNLDKWIPLVKPVKEQIEELAASCDSYEEFMQALAAIAGKLDVKDLQNGLASAMYAATRIASHGERDA